MNPAVMLREVKIEGIRRENREHGHDVVALEVPLTVVVNQFEVATLLCSPGNFWELALGYLLSEGIITWEARLDGITQNPVSGVVRVMVPERFVSLDGNRQGRLVGSGCANSIPVYRGADALGPGLVDSDYHVPAGLVLQAMKSFEKAGTTFRKSGGTHACALDAANGAACFFEDIGRHNALDRIVGRCFLEGIDASSSMVLTTGRISSEIVFKAARLGAPLIVSRSAPTTLSLEAAGYLGVTVVGFARGSRMNCYTHPWRVV